MEKNTNQLKLYARKYKRNRLMVRINYYITVFTVYLQHDYAAGIPRIHVNWQSPSKLVFPR